MEACVDGKLDTIDLQFEDNAAVCVVLASDGYPVSYEKGFPISGLEKFEGKDDYFCFHAGTAFDKEGRIVTNGGRVLWHYCNRKRFKRSKKKKPMRQPNGWISQISICAMISERQLTRHNEKKESYLIWTEHSGIPLRKWQSPGMRP